MKRKRIRIVRAPIPVLVTEIVTRVRGITTAPVLKPRVENNNEWKVSFMSNEEQQLEFPVDWNYKIICLENDDKVLDRIVEALRHHGCDNTPTEGMKSKKGTYRTYKVTVTFNDLDSMRNLSNALGVIEGVKFLL